MVKLCNLNQLHHCYSSKSCECHPHPNFTFEFGGFLGEVTKQKKRVIEYKVMIEEYKRNLANRLEEKSTELAKIFNIQVDTLSQMMNAHHELNVKDIEITTLKL